MTNNSELKKYRIVFAISDGTFIDLQTVEIKAITKEVACNRAFITKVSPNYRNRGCRFFVDSVEIINE